MRNRRRLASLLPSGAISVMLALAAGVGGRAFAGVPRAVAIRGRGYPRTLPRLRRPGALGSPAPRRQHGTTAELRNAEHAAV
jgi:hypothetical protein